MKIEFISLAWKAKAKAQPLYHTRLNWHPTLVANQIPTNRADLAV